MSHEMRTPLNAVIGLSELTLEAGGLSEEAGLNLEKIYNAGATLLSTVNDILDISKIEAGKLELVLVEYDTPSLLNDAITQNIMRKGEKPIQFNLEIGENLPVRLYGDDLRIKQILNNLLSNAFKYTEEGTVTLSVNCERDGGSVWMIASVSDTGKGIKAENIASLFSEYAQADTVTNRKIEGTGLGLSITRKIVEMMDGTISVESEYGKGSVFTVRLRQGFVTEAAIGAEMVKNLKGFRYSDNKRSQNLRLTRIRLPYARVLLVDDVATNLDVAKGMMKPYGMQIDCVNNGQDAINAIRDEEVRYNAIFMDHMMPGMDGIEAVRIIRKEIGTEYSRTVPIIALTANALVGNEDLFLSNGFQALLPKPIEIERLDTVLRQWVRDKEFEKTLAEHHINVDGEMILDIRSGNERRNASNRRTGRDRRSLSMKIRGLDLEKGLERFGGDGESYLQVLTSYAVNTQPLLESIKDVNRDKLADYAIIVHGIKGSSRGICAGAVGDKAQALETAAKDGDFDFVSAHNHAFIKETEKLVADIEDLLEKISAQNPKPKKDKPAAEVLDRLLAGCKSYDMDGVDAAMAELESCEYESDNGLAAWLRENVDRMNFTQIVTRLSEENDGRRPQ
jgi:CheY-like chemotaxis protein